MLKMSIKNNTCKIVAENPDERFQKDWCVRLKEAIAREIDDFLQEVQVAMRNLQPGQEAELSSKPMVVTLKAPAEVPNVPSDLGVVGVSEVQEPIRAGSV